MPHGTHVTVSPALGAAPTTGNVEAWALGAAAVYVTLLTTTRGPRANSTAYSLNDTISRVANDANGDGSATFTEQDSGLRAGTAQVEVAGGAYARVQVTQLNTSWNAP